MTSSLDRFVTDRRTAATIARQLAAHLQTWTCQVPHDPYQAPYLFRPDQARVEVSVEDGRVTLEGLPPASHPVRWTKRRISVAATAEVTRMAQHLTSRLLNTYLPQYTEALARSRADAAREAAVQTVAEQLQALIPSAFRSGPSPLKDRTVYWRGLADHAAVHGQLKLLDPDALHLEIYWLPVRQARRLLHALFPASAPAACAPDHPAAQAPGLPVHRYVDVSTGVLPQHEMDSLDDVPHTTVNRHPHGAWVLVPDYLSDPDDPTPRDWSRWPILREVLLQAGQAGARWVNFDRDGDVPAGLRLYDW